MLIIKTTDLQILISKDGLEFEGLAKNSLRYRNEKSQLSFFLGNSTSVYVWEYWSSKITINDVVATKENVNELLNVLFTASPVKDSSEFISGIYEISLFINKKI